MTTDARRLRVAIAGYGVVGQRRRQFIDGHPDLETVCVCDRAFDGSGRMADGVAYFRTPEDLLTQEFDALFVCMTNDVAPDVTIAGLEKEVHVFCEKPPGRDVADIRRVVDAERAHPGQALKYGFNHRYHESVRDALALAQSGQFGRIINMRGVYGKSQFISYGRHSDWRTERAVAGGGILLDQGIHMVDLMRLFAGEFTQVHSFVSNDYWRHDVEDNAYALMRTEAGVVGMLHSSATQWRHRFSLDITLEKGALILSGILSGSKSYGAETLTVVHAGEDDLGDPKEQVTRYNTDPSWADEIADFADAIRTGRPITEGSSEDALKTMDLVYRIYKADPEWRTRWNLD
ncbi:MAG: oxidoreductase [Rhodospirillales bacterium CG15_BIG_FIL_POST_REV_8_21_14_020_66_15]|nr:MAG: oxidoreductase [Rhodospirillales bacterium CG15_BIG_FIL_POST_REV_8_21_14_020_66_15]